MWLARTQPIPKPIQRTPQKDSLKRGDNIPSAPSRASKQLLAGKCEIDIKVTCHIARHTFATTVTLSNGVPIATVSKLLGHAKLSTTQIYANVVERKLRDDMNSLQDTLNRNQISA